MPASPRRKPRRKNPIRPRPPRPPRGGPGITPTRPVDPGIVVGPVAPVAPVAPAAPALPVVPVAPGVPSPADPRTRAEELIKSVRSRRDDIEKHFYAMGLEFRALSKPLLYRACGYRTFEDLLGDRDLPTRMTAWNLITLVDNIDEPTARQKRRAWCYAVIKYAKEKTGGNVARLLRRNPILPGVGVRIRDAKAAQINAARRHHGTTLSPESKRAAQTEASRLARSYRRKGATSTRARIVESKTGWLVRIELTPEDVRRLLS